MLYEKKMLILSGDGKGVVLIEKSAKGLRFSLSTFDMPTCGKLKAGVITPKSVIIRDLPERDNPSLVFIVDETSADNLHFAVFDAKLRLYGTNGKRMWEANIMDLLNKSDKKPVEFYPQLKSLPPLSSPPKTLPLPDGTGLTQSRLDIYGDELIAESDFYTHLDLSERMVAVDNFLDAPRAVTPSILDGLSPKVEAETTAILDAESADDGDEDGEEDGKEDNAEVDMEKKSDGLEPTVEPIAAATKGSDIYSGTRPCELAARWLKTRSTREIKSDRPNVKPISFAQQVKPIREISFIERAASDIDKLFDNAEKDEKLSELLPDIQWVKVPVDGHMISVGRGGNDFLCYAVSGTYQKISPIGAEAQWLPQDKNVPTGKGYWLLFQSLKDGSIITN